MKRSFLSVVLGLGLVACSSKGSEAPPPVAAPADAVASTRTATQAEAPPARPGVGPHGTPKAAPEKTEVHGLTNVSGVKYTVAGCTGKEPCACSGALIYGHNALAKIGIDAATLASGVHCVFGDFDDNEIADVAFLAADWRPGGPAVPVQVLLFDEVGLRATAPLPKRMRNLGRDAAEGRDVLVEPAARGSYYFAYGKGGRFEMAQRARVKK